MVRLARLLLYLVVVVCGGNVVRVTRRWWSDPSRPFLCGGLEKNAVPLEVNLSPRFWNPKFFRSKLLGLFLRERPIRGVALGCRCPVVFFRFAVVFRHAVIAPRRPAVVSRHRAVFARRNRVVVSRRVAGSH